MSAYRPVTGPVHFLAPLAAVQGNRAGGAFAQLLVFGVIWRSAAAMAHVHASSGSDTGYVVSLDHFVGSRCVIFVIETQFNRHL